VDFVEVSSTLLQDFSKEGVHYAVIGGFALGFWGVTRATADMDFLLLLEDAENAEGILTRYGYTADYKTENVARFQSPNSKFGSIDIIYAFRDVSRNMLKRSVTVEFGEDLFVRTLVPEDIIGLKVQAITNDNSRFNQDFADIQALLAVKSEAGNAIDWEVLGEYFELFKRGDLLQELKATYVTNQ
jgi:hypothetical protein|tara:strand:- start:7659 stop:8216 length:558 start_codon:yes stop_codon:yes gene_type:complete